jgi:hypothetical protein
MGYLKQVRGRLLLGEHPEEICRQLGLSRQVFYRFLELEWRQRYRYLEKAKMNLG